MSQENVELVRRALDGFVAAGYDMSKVDTLTDRGIEFDASRTGNPDAELYRSRDDMVAAVEQWVDTWDAYELKVLELADVPPDRVVSVIHERGRVKGSDNWVEHTRGAVWTIKDQRIVRYEEHQDRASAFEAVGLSE